MGKFRGDPSGRSFSDSQGNSFSGSASIRGIAQNPFASMPRYDSKYAPRYARRILENANYHDELDAEIRSDGMGIRSAYDAIGNHADVLGK